MQIPRMQPLVIMASIMIIAIAVLIVTATLGMDSCAANGTYAIQNVQTGKNLRPYKAGTANGNQIVLYNHHKWKCMTWQFTQVEGNAFQLRNLYTSKTFQPHADPKPGVELKQQPLEEGSLQYWEFIKQPDETFLIRLKDTDLYITISSNETNSPIILKPKQNSNEQRWTLVEQSPWF